MPAEKSRAAAKVSLRAAAYHRLGAARVGDEGIRPGSSGDGGQRLDCGCDGERDVNQVGVAHRAREIARRFLDRAPQNYALEHVFAVKSNSCDGGRVFSKRERERSADEAGADYGDATKAGLVCYGHSGSVPDGSGKT